MPENTLFTCFSEEAEFILDNPEHSRWELDHIVTIDRFWTGVSAIEEKGYGWNNLTQVSSIWNERALFFHFDCWHSWENGHECLDMEAVTLLIRPEGCEDYIEVSTDSRGNLSAMHVIQTPQEVNSNWESGGVARTLFSETEKIWRAVVRLPFEPLSKLADLANAPVAGDAWRLNLRRTAGPKQHREFLSWRPAQTTALDSFGFGHLIFLGAA